MTPGDSGDSAPTRVVPTETEAVKFGGMDAHDPGGPHPTTHPRPVARQPLVVASGGGACVGNQSPSSRHQQCLVNGDHVQIAHAAFWSSTQVFPHAAAVSSDPTHRYGPCVAHAMPQPFTAFV